MTANELNIAICKHLGWEHLERLTDTKRHDRHIKSHLWPNHIEGPEALYNMHQAEMTLRKEGYRYRFGISEYGSSQRSDYDQLLLHGNMPSFMEDGCGKERDMPRGPEPIRAIAGGIYATALQRAIAFALALKLITRRDALTLV